MGIFSTYKLYKQGTAQVVTWLGKTAAQCGFELPSADTSELENKAKKKGSKSNGKIPCASLSQVTVPVKQLLVLAKVISEHFQQLSGFETLRSILNVLRDVIFKRKQWAKAFGLLDEGTLTSNLQHKHFVTVLEDVYGILSATLSAIQLDKGNSVVAVPDEKSTSMEEIASSNLFAVLEIEESMDEEESTGVERSTPKPGRVISPSRPPTVSYELEDHLDDEEVYFMIFCFFSDFEAVRSHIGQSWVDYKSGKLDLAAVAVTTNVALEMLQRGETALIDGLPKKFTSCKQVIGLLLLAVAHSRGVDPNFRHRPDDVINMDLQDIADFTSLPVYIILESFLPAPQERHVTVMKPGFYGQVNSTGRPLSWGEKFIQDKIVLLEFLPEVCILKEVKMRIPGLDELSRGLMDMMRIKTIPLWLVLGCQIYLDIHHTMLTDMDKALNELQNFGLHVSKTVQDYLDFSKGSEIRDWPEVYDMYLLEIKLEADLWVNQDFFASTQKKLLKSEFSTRPYSLLSRHQVLCGLMLFRLNLRLEEAGILLVTGWGSLPSVMHLYNAVKQESSEVGFPIWEDVESVIRMQGIERVFVGDYPRNAEEYLKRYSLVMGYSASMFARNRRGGRRSPASSRGRRTLIGTSTMADVFRGQICENESRSDVTFHKIGKALTKLSPEKKTGRGIKGKPLSFSSVSFLASLQAHIQSEFLALNINYFSLHMRCYNLLREIKVLLDHDFVAYFGPDDENKESQLPVLVGNLFIIAQRSRKIAETLRMGHIKNVQLMKAAELVKNLVKKEGNQEVERVRSVCRGYDWLE